MQINGREVEGAAVDIDICGGYDFTYLDYLKNKYV